MLLLYYYVPETHLEKVNHELFVLGLGCFDGYDCCCWYTKGDGQFRPLSGSDPYIGKIDAIETVSEYKVEMICPSELKNKAIATLKAAHPYETPAFGFLQIID